MALRNGRQTVRMLRQGRDIILANNSISLADFRTALEAGGEFVAGDWTDGQNVMGELGFLDPSPTWVATRAFWAGSNTELARAVYAAVAYYFPSSIVATRSSLTAARDDLVAERTALTDLIQNDLLPFVTTPPAGVSAVVVTAVQERINQIRDQRELIVQTIDELTNSLAGLP
jgi:hypothetical protein